MFHGLVCHFELIFGHMTIKKCDFCEVEGSMFHVVIMNCRLIFCFLSNPKCDFFEVD